MGKKRMRKLSVPKCLGCLKVNELLVVCVIQNVPRASRESVPFAGRVSKPRDVVLERFAATPAETEKRWTLDFATSNAQPF
jgi:hypothetical protein